LKRSFERCRYGHVNIVNELRLRAGLTQDLLAEPSGVSATSISRYERGSRSPTLTILTRIAAAAGFEATVSFTPIPPAEDRRAFVCRLDGAISVHDGADADPTPLPVPNSTVVSRSAPMTSFGAMWARRTTEL
jgi:transcriptional regulator with XRE-family HTH domain